MRFKKGDIVSHVNSIHRFYVVLDDYYNGQVLVEDFEFNFFNQKEKHVFIAKYLLTKSERRDYIINNLIDE